MNAVRSRAARLLCCNELIQKKKTGGERLPPHRRAGGGARAGAGGSRSRGADCCGWQGRGGVQIRAGPLLFVRSRAARLLCCNELIRKKKTGGERLPLTAGFLLRTALV
jgi:hypothetical protein